MRRHAPWILFLFLITLAAGAEAAVTYSLTPIGPFAPIYYTGGTGGSSGPYSYTYGINDLGVVTGYGSTVNAQQEAFTWTVSGGLVLLGDLPGGNYNSVGRAINNAGEAVGYSSSSNGNEAFLWTAGAMVPLGDLPGGSFYSSASDMNESGQIVGSSAPGVYSHAVLWQGGSMLDLGILAPSTSGAAASNAFAINEAGQVVGNSNCTEGTQAFFWENGTMTGIGDLPGGSFNSTAYDINDLGLIVGQGNSAIGNEAVSWDVNHVIHSLGFGAYSKAVAANNLGQIIGNRIGGVPVIWNSTDGMKDLATLLDSSAAGWTLSNVEDINESGQIVGQGVSPGGESQAILLTPSGPAEFPTIAFSPGSFTFSALQGGPNPGSQSLSISNSGTGTLNWAVASSYTWLGLSPLSGQQSGTVTVSVDVTGLAAGSYSGTITITGNATNSPQTVPVTLTIQAPPPTIGFSPTSFSWTLPQGSGWSTPQQLTITNTGGGTMTWFATPDQSWISASPVSGMVASGAYNYSDVRVNLTGKAPGTYTGNVIITAAGATNSPQSVPVTLTVTPAVVITYPNGGETLRYAQTVTVTWTANPPPGAAKTDTYYTTDAGATWKLIKSARGVTTSCSWKVPTLKKPSSQCLVKTQLKDAGGVVLGEDVSNAYFTITK